MRELGDGRISKKFIQLRVYRGNVVGLSKIVTAHGRVVIFGTTLFAANIDFCE